MKRIKKTIYDSFYNYRKEDINLIIAMLSDEDKFLIYLRNGEDLEHPKLAPDCTKEHISHYSKTLMSKLRKRILAPERDRSTDNMQCSERAIKILINKIDKYLIGEENTITMLWLIRTPKFERYLMTLPFNEAMTIILWIGYIDGKFYSLEDIAHFLGKSEEEIYQTIKNVMINYLPELDRIIDKLLMKDSIKMTRVLKINNKRGVTPNAY